MPIVKRASQSRARRAPYLSPGGTQSQRTRAPNTQRHQEHGRNEGRATWMTAVAIDRVLKYRAVLRERERQRRYTRAARVALSGGPSGARAFVGPRRRASVATPLPPYRAQQGKGLSLVRSAQYDDQTVVCTPLRYCSLPKCSAGSSLRSLRSPLARPGPRLRASTDRHLIGAAGSRPKRIVNGRRTATNPACRVADSHFTCAYRRRTACDDFPAVRGTGQKTAGSMSVRTRHV